MGSSTAARDLSPNAGLIALIKTLELSERQKVSIYMDSRYVFAMAHIHREIYKRRELLASVGKEIKNKTEILALLMALFLLKKGEYYSLPRTQKKNPAMTL